MKKTLRTASIFTVSLLAILFVAAAPPPEGSVGLFSKVILDVARKAGEKDWEGAKRGETLSSGDRVRTGDKSLAIIKFKDGSLVSVRERSELTVTGSTNAGAFSKSVDIQNGVVGFSIQKQKPAEEFRFTSPTSVASIRGTGGVLTISPLGDTLTVTDGTVSFTNRTSGRSIDVHAGFTGLSTVGGNLETHPSTSGEKRSAEDALKSGDTQQKLEFELRDNQGKSKKLRIDYKE